MGTTSELSYDAEEFAINFNNLSREFRNTDPVRSFYIMEEKKVHDVIQGLLNVNSQKIERSKFKMCMMRAITLMENSGNQFFH